MRYHTPSTFEDAVAIAAAAGGATRFLAGGTDVLVQMRSGVAAPEDLIDLKYIQGVGEITRLSDGSWHLGVAVPGAKLRAHTHLASEWPGIVEAMGLVGSTQVQSRATLAGNLCNGSPAADSVPALVAAQASVVILGPHGTRQIPVEAVPKGPGRTTLAHGEVISAIRLPPRGPNAADAYLRFIPRSEMDIAVAGCAVSLRLDGGLISEARVALGAVAPTVLVASEAARAIVGTSLDEDALQKLADAASAACKPITDRRGTIEFRTHMAGILAKRAARIAYERAKGSSK